MEKRVVLLPTAFFLAPKLGGAVLPSVARMEAIVAALLGIDQDAAVGKAHAFELVAPVEYVSARPTYTADRELSVECCQT